MFKAHQKSIRIGLGFIPKLADLLNRIGIRLKVDKKDTVDLDSETFNLILDFYPEEKLKELEEFKNIFQNKYISLSELIKAARKIHIPWQFFLLEQDKLKKELQKIEKKRSDKFPSSRIFISKRKGQGIVTSKRILDRLIRVQSFISNLIQDDSNFNGALRELSVKDSALYIKDYFDINIDDFRKREASDSLKYLTEKIQSKNNINVSQGVLNFGVLPQTEQLRLVYRNTSGFVIQDKKIPFIFLPHELNPDENYYRQILTLVYMVVIIGLDQYDYSFEVDFGFKKYNSDQIVKRIFDIVSELLLPDQEIKDFITNNKIINDNLEKKNISQIKDIFKVSYSAILTIFKRRNYFDPDLLDSLKLSNSSFSSKPFFGRTTQKKAIQKFSGMVAINLIDNEIKNDRLKPVSAQMLLFGRPEKEGYLRYIKEK